jgi:hypothetical protein
LYLLVGPSWRKGEIDAAVAEDDYVDEQGIELELTENEKTSLVSSLIHDEIF